jgi:medium-chain acyl-[acyl-carrier-protein] hydrolase
MTRQDAPRSASSTGWLVRTTRSETDAPRRIFCFGHAGVGAAAFRSWAAAFEPQCDVYALRLPGREALIGEPLVRTSTDLVGPLLAELGPLLDRPFALFGHCSGADLAFTLGRTLTDSAVPPSLIVAAGQQAPTIPRGRDGSVRNLSDAEFVATLERLGGMDPTILAEPELMEIVLPSLRADFEVGEELRSGSFEQVSCPIAVMAGQDDTLPIADLVAWRGLTSSSFCLRLVPGGHFFTESESLAVAQAVAAELQLVLERDH